MQLHLTVLTHDVGQRVGTEGEDRGWGQTVRTEGLRALTLLTCRGPEERRHL